MEKQFDHLEEFTSKIMKESELEQPSATFMKDVMKRVEKQTSTVKYRPLITTRGWFVVTLAIAACMAIFTFIPEAEAGYVNGPLQNLRDTQIALPELQFSKIMVYGIAFLALFLLQIPFLKRYMNQV